MDRTQEFLAAVTGGDLATVHSLLEIDPTLAGARNERGDSAVLLAAYRKQDEILELLLAAGVELDLYEAAVVGSEERVGALIATAPESIDRHAHDGWTPLHLAAFFGNPEVARALLDAGADVGVRSESELAPANTPLHAAVAGGQAALVEMLVAAGADPDAQDGTGHTPLHLAAHAGQTDMARTLLAAGGDPNALSNDEISPLTMAEAEGHEETAALLIEHGGTSAT